MNLIVNKIHPLDMKICWNEVYRVIVRPFFYILLTLLILAGLNYGLSGYCLYRSRHEPFHRHQLQAVWLNADLHMFFFPSRIE